MERYDHTTIESKWQKRWEQEGQGSAEEDPTTLSRHGAGHPSLKRRGGQEGKSYVLVEFPYPSGDGLHVGHVRSYTALDAVARKRRMEGKNVLFPIGWDAFGLPTENYALKTGVHPRVATDKNIANFRRQMKALGLSFDWSREVDTTDPAYYKWTQWIFLQLLKHGLAYRATIPISWCPKDKIGLANEEVVAGKCERCGTEVERRMQTQWMLKITAYAERLLKDLDTVDYQDRIKTQQQNWIGRSEGAEVRFEIWMPDQVRHDKKKSGAKKKILIGTRNAAKIEMIRKAFKDVAGLNFIGLNDVPDIDDASLVEGDDDMENARRKSEFYFKHTGIPTISTDHFLWIEKWPENNGVIHHIRKLANLKSPRATDEEVIAWFQHFLAPVGGSSKSRFDYAIAYTDAQGTSIYRSEGIESILQTDRAGHFPEGYPTEALLKDPKTGEFRVDQPKDKMHQSITTYLRKNVLTRILGDRGVTVFTTRPDTLFGATYLVLSPEHPLVDVVTTEKQKKVVEKYKKQVAKKSDLERTALEKEKTGVFTGAFAVNPANNEKIPVWIADYVLMSYGTGAIMAVPAHDERDHEFSKKFKLPILKVIKPPSVMPKNIAETAVSPGGWGHLGGDIESDCWTGEGTMMNSGKFDGLTSEEGRKKIVKLLESEGKAKLAVNYKLRDWVFSRQHYWGEPIPVVHCEQCRKDAEETKWKLNFFEPSWRQLEAGYKTVETRALNPDEKDRYFGDIKVGDIIKGTLKGTNETMYLRVTERKIVKQLKDLLKQPDLLQKMMGQRSMPKTVTDLEKAWSVTTDYLDRIKKYGLVCWTVEHVIPGVVPVETLPVELPDVEKYQPSGTGKSPLEGIPDWVNVKCPHCGGKALRETDTMPNWAGSSWYFLRYCDPENDKEFASMKKLKYWMPVDLYNGGMEHTTLHLLYSRFWHKFLFDHGYVPTPEPYRKRVSHGIVLASDGRKMSKSFGNVVNPDELVKQYGADSVRLYEMFMGPFEDAIPWDPKGIVGMRRFLDKVWRIGEKKQAKDCPLDVVVLTHRTIKKVTDDLEQLHFNTAISSLMILANTFDRLEGRPREEFEYFLLLLEPFAPHLAREVLDRLRRGNLYGWPKSDDRLVDSVKTVTIAIQVNGKLRSTVKMPAGAPQPDVEMAAKADANVSKHLTREPKKVIFVKDRLINFVV